MPRPKELFAVRDLVLKHHRELDWNIFWPDQFVRAGIGDQQTVLGILKALVDDGFFEARVSLRCGNGDPVWEGSPSDYELTAPTSGTCHRCGSTDEYSDRLFLKFLLTESAIESADGSDDSHPKA